MPQRLFTTGKVGLFLDKYVPSMEKRRDGEVKILTLTLRVQPFDAKLATAIDDGVGEESNVRPTLFQLNHPDPKPHLSRVNFALGCPRQNMKVYASPDTAEPRILFEQVRIGGTHARTEKNVNGYAFIFTASLGPVSRSEQEYIHEWMLSQRFVTFDESEPSLEFEAADDAEQVEDPEEIGEVVNGRTPMWDDEPAAPKPADKAKQRKNVNRKLHSHTSKKKNAKKGRK